MADHPSSDPPIVPVDYVAGVKVVDIGDVRVARGMSRRPHSLCRHARMNYDQQERRIWCADCETNVDGFEAFIILVKHFAETQSEIDRRREKIVEAEAHALISVAAKNADKAWRSQTVPCCPHCGHGLFPEHFKKSPDTMSRQYALDRLARDPLRRTRVSSDEAK